MFESNLTRLFCTSGNIFLRMILSTISGTAETMAGFISLMASTMSEGEGCRVRKWLCAPAQKASINSNICPYMWAMGNILNMSPPTGTCGANSCITKSRLPHNAL